MVALRLTDKGGVRTMPYELDLTNNGPEIPDGVAQIVSVIGYPFGKSVNDLAIWATGFIASEIGVGYNGLPVFLIDCRTRHGQSGSAVIAYRGPGATPVIGGITLNEGGIFKFLGIYSGRINEESDLGMVWKAIAIREMVEAIPID